MHWRTTAVLLLATIGIGAYISLRELKQPTREERAALAKQLIDIPPESVTQLTLQVPTGTIVVERREGLWRLIPPGVRADASRIANLLDQASPLAAQRVLTGSPEKPLDYAAFGLSPEAGSITWLANGRSTTLLFGEKTPAEEFRYAKRADRPEVCVVPASLFDESDVPREQFRDPSLIPVTGGTVDTLAVESRTSAFALARRGQMWWLTKPLEDRAGRGEVATLVNQLGGIRIARFVDDAPQVERLADWGFNHPKAALTLTVKDAPGTVTVFFGAPLPDAPGMVYAKRSDEPSLYAVAASDVDALLVDPHSLRSKACFELFTNQASKIEFQSGDARWTAVKRDGRWQAEETGTVLDAGRVEERLNAASDLRLGGFVDEAPANPGRYGLNPPRGALTVWSEGEATPQRLLVGDTVKRTTNRYGRIDGRPAIVRLPELVTNLVGTTADALRPGEAEAAGAAPLPATAPPIPLSATP